MSEINIRRAKDDDIPTLDKLLFQVHEVHHKARPDLFKADAKKYTDEQLKEILANDKTPVFVAESGSLMHFKGCWPYAIAPSAARSSVRSAMTSPVDWIEPALQGKPEAAVG